VHRREGALRKLVEIKNDMHFPRKRRISWELIGEEVASHFSIRAAEGNQNEE